MEVRAKFGAKYRERMIRMLAFVEGWFMECLMYDGHKVVNGQIFDFFFHSRCNDFLVKEQKQIKLGKN